MYSSAILLLNHPIFWNHLHVWLFQVKSVSLTVLLASYMLFSVTYTNVLNGTDPSINEIPGSIKPETKEKLSPLWWFSFSVVTQGWKCQRYTLANPLHLILKRKPSFEGSDAWTMGKCFYRVPSVCYLGKSNNFETTVSIHGDIITYVNRFCILLYVLYSIGM